MALALFDLDETLLAADSDVLWGEYLCREQLVDADSYRARSAEFYRQYKAGEFDVDGYLSFVTAPLAALPLTELEAHRARYIERDVQPVVLQEGLNLIGRHRFSGDLPVIVTATIDFIARPIGELLGISDVIAPIAERTNGGYTGTTTGVASFGPGKVSRVLDWLGNREEDPLTLEDSWFYSDSINDLPLLDAVSHPVAVDPDDALRNVARERGWKLISLRPQPDAGPP